MIVPRIHFLCRRSLIFLIILIILIVLGFWLLEMPFLFLKERQLEPLSQILILIFSLISSLLLAPVAENLIEKIISTPKTQHPDMWIRVNHSNPTVEYIPLSKQRNKLKKSNLRSKDINKILHKYYRKYVGRLYTVRVNNEDSGTLNFRVKGILKKPILLRIHKRIKDECVLKTIHEIQKYLYKEVSFNPSYKECLKPLITSTGKEYVYHEGKFVSAFLFAKNVLHYPGQTISQIESLAMKYGSVQKALQNLPSSINVTNAGFYDFMTQFKDCAKKFKGVCTHCRDTMRDNMNPKEIWRIFHQNIQYLEEQWDELGSTLEESNSKTMTLLHDFHPHNTFFKNDECVLIYDYEAVSNNWSHSAALSFTIHRFVREFIRNLKERQFSNYKKRISFAVETFLDSYKQGGMSLPEDFRSNLHLGIKRTNFAKIIDLMHKIKAGAHLADRKDETLCSELIKFISYLKEADEFK